MTIIATSGRNIGARGDLQAGSAKVSAHTTGNDIKVDRTARLPVWGAMKSDVKKRSAPKKLPIRQPVITFITSANRKPVRKSENPIGKEHAIVEMDGPTKDRVTSMNANIEDIDTDTIVKMARSR